MLNELETNYNLVKENLDIGIQRLRTLESTLEDAKKQQLTIKNEWNEKETISLYDKLEKEYKHNYDSYKTEIASSLTGPLAPTIARRVSDYINQQISNLIQNPKFIEEVSSLYNKKTGSNITGPQLVGLIVNNIQRDLANWNIGSTINTDVVNYFSNLTESKQMIELNQALQYGVQNIITNTQSILEKILDNSITQHNNIGKLLQESPQDYANLMNILKNSQLQNSDLLNKIELVYNDLAKSAQNNAPTKAIAVLRGKLTLFVNQALQDALGLKVDKTLTKAERQKIIKKILTQYQSIITSDTTAILQKYLSNAKVTAPSVGELLAKPGVVRQIIGILSSYLPGKEITAKADIVFEYTPQPITAFFLKLTDLGINLDDISPITDFEKNFLKEYKKLTRGATDVQKAQEAWYNAQKKNIQQQKDILSKVKNDSDKNKLIDFFQNIIHGQISVKTYEFYNNNLGFHMGSLGGSGKVVDAVPNIVKMLELGGITGLDAELIIQILLNCFPDSIIGTKPWDDIKNLLIGGAAMMLFDDGFANAKSFLEKAQEDLLVDKNSFGNTLHLLVLNGIYIPQSVVLTRIVRQLKLVYNDIVQQQTEVLTDPKNSLDSNQQDQLVLNNPITYMDLMSVYTTPGYQNKAEKWNRMSSIAQESVTISFLFMSGMLDIMEKLAAAFN